REVKSRDLADAVRAPRMKRRGLLLRRLSNFAEHLARSGEIESAFRSQLPERRKHVMSAVDVRVHGREAVEKTLGDKALSREMVTLVKRVLAEHVEDAWITLEARGMKNDSIHDARDAVKAPLRILERDS